MQKKYVFNIQRPETKEFEMDAGINTCDQEVLYGQAPIIPVKQLFIVSQRSKWTQHVLIGDWTQFVDIIFVIIIEFRWNGEKTF